MHTSLIKFGYQSDLCGDFTDALCKKDSIVLYVRTCTMLFVIPKVMVAFVATVVNAAVIITLFLGAVLLAGTE